MLMAKDRKTEPVKAEPAKPDPKSGTTAPASKPEITKQEIAKQNAPETGNPVPEMSKEAKAVSNEAQKAAQDDMASVIKEMESALYAVKFYPVAVNEQSKNEAVGKLIGIYNTGSETVRQMLIYMVHENISQNCEMKALHTYDYFKAKNPTLDPAQVRMNVYRAMFNYNTSIEGIAELIRMVGKFRGGDDAAKLMTYHYSHASSYESESNRMLRAVIIETLGKSESKYALTALLEYARYTDNENAFNRIVAALLEWKDRLETMKLKDDEKDRLRTRLQEVLSRELSESHYG